MQWLKKIGPRDRTESAEEPKSSIVSKSSRQLCSACEKLNLDYLLPHMWEDDDGTWRHRHWMRDGKWSKNSVFADLSAHRTVFRNLDHGSLESVISRSAVCLFCRLLVESLKLHDNNIFSSWSSHDRRVLYIFLNCSIAGIAFKKWQEPRHSQHRFELNRLGIRIDRANVPGMSSIDESFQFDFPHSIRVGQSPQSSTSKVIAYTARPRPQRCDIPLFKSWIQLCDETHRECHSQTKTADTSEISSPKQLRQPYHSITGSVKRSDEQSVMRLIDVHSSCISTFPTGDAVFKSYIALSYVWGDSQDNIALKSVNYSSLSTPNGLINIPKTISDAMKLVSLLGKRYLWVDSLCIIQDNPEDKAYQIPRMAAIYANAFLTVVAAAGDGVKAGLPGISSERPAEITVDVGDFRAFGGSPTLDLSKGSPLASTTWSSRGWTFQENVLSPRCLIFTASQVYWTCKSKQWLEDNDLESQDGSLIWSKIEGTQELTVSNFGNLLERYTAKTLTYDSDILDAFAGVLDAIPGDFFWGIPKEAFGRYLCWSNQKSWPSRQLLTRRTLPGAPSWSWASWKGPISMNHDGDVTTPVVIYYRFCDKDLKHIYCPSKTEKTLTGKCELSRIPTEIALEENHIIFWASCSRLQAKTDGHIDGYAGYFSLYPTTKDPHSVGRVRADTDFQVEDGALYDFTVIARHGHHDVFVLMLSLPVNGVSRRECLLTLNKQSWKRAMPELKLIVLE